VSTTPADPKLGKPGHVDLLRAVPNLRGLSDHDLGRIAALLGERSVAPGETLIEEGTEGSQSFLVAEGEASVSIGGVLIARVGPGEFVGELALLTDEPRGATVRAETSMKVRVLDKATLAALLDPITEALLGTLARRLRHRPVRADAAAAEPWTVGAAVAVRSRYASTWVEGFEIAEVDLAGDEPQIQLRRRSDGALLPVFFGVEEIRLA
jgi:CRP-like cAMP-binding protein